MCRRCTGYRLQTHARGVDGGRSPTVGGGHGNCPSLPSSGTGFLLLGCGYTPPSMSTSVFSCARLWLLFQFLVRLAPDVHVCVYLISLHTYSNSIRTPTPVSRACPFFLASRLRHRALPFDYGGAVLDSIYIYVGCSELTQSLFASSSSFII